MNKYKLFNNYPNPFNSSTIVQYSVPKESFVTIKVFDLIGREITTLVDERKSEGNYTINFNAGSLPSGIYIYRMQSGGFVSTKKFVLLKKAKLLKIIFFLTLDNNPGFYKYFLTE